MTLSNSLKKDSKVFFDDVIDYTIIVHQKFTRHNVILFLLYGIGLGIIDIDYKVISCVLCYSISAISFFVNILSKKYLIKHKKHVVMICNSYLFIFLLLLRILYFFHASQISYTLLICSIVTTAMTNIFTGYYGAILLCISVIHMAMYFFLIHSKDVIESVGYILNDFLIIIFAIGINQLFTGMKYSEFKQKKFLQNESYRDPLTNMYNRRYVERYVDLQMDQEVQWAVLIMDLDNFKSVNDVLGHEMGDELLGKISSILKGCFRKSDCVARIGGDEFLIALPDIADRKSVTDKISNILRNFPIVYDTPDKNRKICVSASIGVAFGKVGKHEEFDQLYRRADENMYKAKNQGKGIAVVEEFQGEKESIIRCN